MDIIQPTWTPRSIVPAAMGARGGAGIVDSLVFVLEAIGHGIFIVDRAGRVVHANRTARRECRDGGPLRLIAGLLHAASGDKDDAAIQAAMRSGQGGRFAMAVLHRDDGPLGFAVVPLDGPPREADAPAMIVLLGRRDICDPLSIELFARAHGLTLAETRLLRALCAGQRAHEAAQAFGVAISTVRTQIGSIRQKVGADSLGDLARIVASLPPVTPMRQAA
jgi:DNA-binding CsgD family transcriptional regulator